METNRQKKIGGVIQKDLVDILQGEVRKNGVTNLVISVSKVSVTSDLSVATVYLSIFPQEKAKETLEGIKSNSTLIKHDLSQRVRLQLRRVPNLVFFIDDSLDYIEKIDNALSNRENPIENRDLLEKEENHKLNFPLYIAKRYIFSRSKNNAINIINYIASMGIIVGTMALFVVLSVFSGLKLFSLSFTNEIDPDLKATSTYGKSFLITPSQEAQIKNIEGVASYTKIIEERVLFLFKDKQQVTYLKGVDKNYAVVNDIQKKLFNGNWLKPDTFQVVIGYGIARDFSLGILDFENPLQIFAPKPGKGGINNPDEAFNKTDVMPVGIYSVSEELDSKYVFADLGLTQELLMYKPNQISGIELKLKPNASESTIKSKLETIFDNKITLKNRAQLNESLYKMLNTENIAVYLIFTLVIIVALFNLIGALIMMILDKKGNLKTLFNLGTEIKHLRKIFLLQGTLLSILGGIVGMILGVILVLLQQKYQLVMITETLAFPVVFTLENVLIVMATIVSLGFIASLIASSRVSKKLLN